RERDAVLELPADRVVDYRIAVAEDERPDPHAPVGVSVAVGVPDLRPLPTNEVLRSNAANVLARSLGQRLRAGRDPLDCARPQPVGLADDRPVRASCEDLHSGRLPFQAFQIRSASCGASRPAAWRASGSRAGSNQSAGNEIEITGAVTRSESRSSA